ncbi:acyclic terpene utilization AtuA family protein [Gordonia sp. LSe1-13]|uniref:Acyclic terpene utilization AtuA family protein n=1 Tax=Gordonia sesuvii TaxID=3116777 RepID=A0ABU7MAY0_9ACTN|nr:acyclic terpene utilization AtuA family protein [Gordonia sp. LSe1-13]
MAREPIRIANFSGYLGDRRTAIDEAMAGDRVDVLMGDYLAEITLAALSAAHQRNADRGYVDYFVDQVRPHLAAISERGIKVVTNAGGFHPAGLAAVLRDEIHSAGVDLRVAHVEGDNILTALPQLREQGHSLANLDTGEPLADWVATPFAANAYLGGWGVAAALGAGADIVICGRVTDASLTAGPAAWWHDWAPDDWDALAGAVLAGHVIECGAHAVGGNFSGFLDIANRTVPGFPIAEISADGSCVVTKHGRDGGEVTLDTVTAQIMYEIQGPVYLNPDVTVRLDDVRVTDDGPDRVRVSGASGAPPPPTTKVAIFGPVGFTVVNTVFVTSPHIEEKIAMIRDQLLLDMPDGVVVDLTQIGTAADDPESQWAATVALRVMATAPTADLIAGADLGRRLGSLYLQGIPGFYHDGAAGLHSAPRPRVDYWPGLLPLSALTHDAVLGDGRRIAAVVPPDTAYVAQPIHPEPHEAPLAERVTRAPLGVVAHARSGDKGGNSNVGVWTRDPRVWLWLRRYLTSDELRRLIPETKDLDIQRHEFPELQAVHFVLRGLLGTGGSSNTRVDQVGKAVGEYLRSRQVLIPDDLLADAADAAVEEIL